MNRKGITLIELIVVMVIIAIGSLLFIPNIGGWMPSYRLRSAARDIASTMRTAQMKAISSNFRYQVSFPTSVSFVLQYQNTLGGWTSDGNAQTLPSGVSMTVINIAGRNAVFNTDSTSSAGSITLQNNRGSQRRLTLTSTTGRVRITIP